VAPYASRIPDSEVKASWQLVEPTGVRLMHGPAGVRLLEYLPATRWLAWVLRKLRLTPFVTAVNRVLGRIRKPLGRFFPNPAGPAQLAVGRTLCVEHVAEHSLGSSPGPRSTNARPGLDLIRSADETLWI
jgi:hypothetical protein